MLEAFISGVFGHQHCLSTPGTKHILGQGEAGFNPLAETALFVFIQEAKAGGKSIVCDDQFKTWLSENKQQIRKMRQDPFTASNYASSFLFTNHVNCLKADGPTLRRLLGQKASDEKIWDKEYFDRLWKLTEDPKALQEIFDYLHNRDISQFDEHNKPVTDFMERMAEDGLTNTQRYVVGLCNGDRPIEVVEGNAKEPGLKLYNDYQAYCQDHGVQGRFILEFKNFKTELEGLNIQYKQLRHAEFGDKGKGMCFSVEAAAVEEVMQKLQKKREWKLLRTEVEDDE